MRRRDATTTLVLLTVGFLAVDVNHDEARPQVLVFEDGDERVVDIGIGRNIGNSPAAAG